MQVRSGFRAAAPCLPGEQEVQARAEAGLSNAECMSRVFAPALGQPVGGEEYLAAFRHAVVAEHLVALGEVGNLLRALHLQPVPPRQRKVPVRALDFAVGQPVMQRGSRLDPRVVEGGPDPVVLPCPARPTSTR